MRLVIAAGLAAAAALFVANMLGVAVAEAPTVTSLRTVNVEGVASLPIAPNADAATASGGYHQAMAAAVDDGKVKAEVLAGKLGAALGAAQTITEDGGDIECSSGSEEDWQPYQGERPDFGSARNPGNVLGKSEGPEPPAAAAPSASKRTSTKKHRKRHKHPVATKAAAPGCKLTAQV